MGLSNPRFAGLVSGGEQGSAVGVVAFLPVIGSAFGLVMSPGAVQRRPEVLIQPH